MKEIVDVTAHTAPAMMLIEAMTRESKREDLFAKFNVPKIPLQHPCVEVKLTINGTPVNFLKTVEEMWERMERCYLQDVEAAAKKLIRQTRMEKIEEILSRAQDELEMEVDRLLKEQNEPNTSNT